MCAADRFERVEGTRIVADPAALDRIGAPEAGHLVRLAPDDLLVLPAPDRIEVSDPHAIVEPESGFSAGWFGASELAGLQSVCEWEFPAERPAQAQGHVAGVAVTMLFSGAGALVIVPTVTVHHLHERLNMAGRRS